MAAVPAIVDLAWCRSAGCPVVLADVRWYLDGRDGREAYERGHLPGARFVDFQRWLAGPASSDGGRNPLPEPAVFAEGMSSLGIGDEDVVVGYDDQGGVIAGRLVWMLRTIGVPAALLDGGLLAHDGALETGPGESPPRGSFAPRPWPAALLAGVDDALDRSNVVIDARGRDRYRGEPDSLDPRAGHIPGALSVPCRESLDASGRFRPADELRMVFEAAGIADASRVVAYCGSGVSACHDLLALEHAGLGVGRLYVGSWSAYSRAADRPVALGDAPGDAPG